MLELVIGRAGAGKTEYIMERIRENAASRGKQLLIVPEQYSHETERRLCACCGDSVSLYAEVLSFSRLASRVFSEVGGAADTVLDNGGRLLVMSLALKSVSSELRLYGAASRKPDFLKELLDAVDEFKSGCISSEVLADASEWTEGRTRDKLHDLSLIAGAYDALTARELADPGDRLTRLAERIGQSSLCGSGSVYIDGFTDFTAQETLVIRELVSKAPMITVCLCWDGEAEGLEVFAHARETAARLMNMAKERGREVRTVLLEGRDAQRSGEIAFLEKSLFGYGGEHYPGECENIELYSGDTPASELEFAAARIRELVRGGGYRYRDIAVAARGFERYGGMAENIFDFYEVPHFTAKMSDILQKPVLALITAALDIVNENWKYDPVFRYLKTNLTGISPEECDILENYILKWNIRGSLWTREGGWTFNPAGYMRDMTGPDRETLARINDIRRRVREPLIKLRKAGQKGAAASEQAMAVYSFLEEISLPERLDEKAGELVRAGNAELAVEYRQLWDILILALEQAVSILKDTPMALEEFSGLFKLVLSQYDVGSIPVSLDCVTLGDMSRMRRGDVKCLIVIGADDDSIPRVSEKEGLLSRSEREQLVELGVELGGTGDDALYREMNIIYTALTRPVHKLILSYPRRGATGGEKRPSFVANRLSGIFDISVTEIESLGQTHRTASLKPCFELAVSEKRGIPGKAALAAARWFENGGEWSERLREIRNAPALPRGPLSEDAVLELYGADTGMSASRVDKYYSCRFAYFMRYGLRAKLRDRAEFDAPEIGSFMHYILENVTRDVKTAGGFASASTELLDELTEKYVKEFVEKEFPGFKDKPARFVYLFKRLVETARQVVRDMAEELSRSDFEPLDFELRFAKDGPLPPAEITDGESSVSVSGLVDRVDGWIHDGVLYLRVVDYKTGRKSFNLSDIWYGMGMQMLLYLFTLQKSGGLYYGEKIVPAGVLYAPARDLILPMPKSSSDEEIEKERSGQLRRSGLILDDTEVIEAMEKCGTSKPGAPKFLPVKFKKDGSPSGGSLATAEQFGRLNGHIDKMLLQISRELKRGSIDANPYQKGSAESACEYCEYKSACHFNEKAGDRKRYLGKLKPSQIWERLES